MVNFPLLYFCFSLPRLCGSTTEVVQMSSQGKKKKGQKRKRQPKRLPIRQGVGVRRHSSKKLGFRYQARIAVPTLTCKKGMPKGTPYCCTFDSVEAAQHRSVQEWEAIRLRNNTTTTPHFFICRRVWTFKMFRQW